MKTKIIYVITSNGEDHYVEQALMSIWSCRHYNPQANIIVVADIESQIHIEKYNEFKELVGEFIYQEFEENVSKPIRSRILKTTLRNIVKGDFLYVDTDTIFCDSISEIDDFNFDIGLVEDLHFEKIDLSPFKEIIKRKLKETFNQELNSSKYYNSGVIYAKDNEIVKKIYELWHINWLVTQSHGEILDQPSLLKVTNEHQNLISTLPGEYNVQMLLTVKYLNKGKILHFFNYDSGEKTSLIHPFFGKNYYENLKENKIINEEIKQDIINVKTLFHNNTFIIGPLDIPFWLSQQSRILKKLIEKKSTKKIVTLFLKILYRITYVK